MRLSSETAACVLVQAPAPAMGRRGDRVSISRRKIFSPRTDLDDRPRLGGKTPPSPGRRVPVDSPRRPTFLKSVEIASPLPARHGTFARTFRRTFRRRLWKKIFSLLEPTSTTGRGSAARPRPRPGDACRSIEPRRPTFLKSVANRIAVAGTPWKLRTDVPTDVPTPAMAAGSDSERWGKLITVGDALRTLPFFWYGISQKSLFRLPARHKRRQETAACGLVQGPATGYGTQATASRYLEEKKFLIEPDLDDRPRLCGKTPALARATRAGR